MDIKNHGDWTVYQPDPFPADLPANVMFARRADGFDWYDYVNSGRYFDPGTIKLTVIDGVVGAAVTDPTRLFPAKATVLEVAGVSVDDPQALFGRKVYDRARGAFAAPAASPEAPDRVAELLARIEALESRVP